MGGTKGTQRWIVALLSIVSLMLAAPAQATFTPIGAVSDKTALTPGVGMDEGGTALFVWNAFHSQIDCGPGFCFVVEARARTASGALGSIETISDPTRNASDPHVAVDEDGDAVFVWVAVNPVGQTIEARARSAAGALSPIQVISDPGATAVAPQVAIDDDGDAVFTWQQLDGTTDCDGAQCLRVHARGRSAAGVLSPTQTLSDPATTNSGSRVDVDEDGDAVFTWLRLDSTPECGSCFRIRARARTAGGALKATQTVATGKTGVAQVAVDDDGNAVFAWDRFDGTDDCGGGECSRIQTRRRSASGSLSSTQTLSASGQDAVAPQVDVDGAGKAYFVWTRGDGTNDCEDSACFRAQARTRTAGGSLSSTQTLSYAGRHAFVPQVAVDERGNAVFVWERIDTSVDCGEGNCSQVQVRSRTPGGSLTGTRILSDLGPDAAPAVAVDRDGGLDPSRADAAVDWIGPDRRIEAAVQKGDS